MPNRKVGAGMLAGSLTTIIVWLAKAAGGLEIPGEVGAGITTLLTFAVSYFVNEP